MTEGLYQFLNFNFQASLEANIFAPFIVPLLLFYVVRGLPKIDTQYKERAFFGVFILLSIVVNILN